jgi:hypothetical protein
MCLRAAQFDRRFRLLLGQIRMQNAELYPGALTQKDGMRMAAESGSKRTNDGEQDSELFVASICGL